MRALGKLAPSIGTSHHESVHVIALSPPRATSWPPCARELMLVDMRVCQPPVTASEQRSHYTIKLPVDRGICRARAASDDELPGFGDLIWTCMPSLQARSCQFRGLEQS